MGRQNVTLETHFIAAVVISPSSDTAEFRFEMTKRRGSYSLR
jgi:hypothetical protein